MTGSNISLFRIYPNDNKDPINGGAVTFTYYESILDNSVRATATFVDTGNRSSGGDTESVLEYLDTNLTAGEKVEIVLEDQFGQKLSFKDEYALRVKEIKNIIEDTMKTIFAIDFYSKESIDNELVENRVVKRYDGKISDSVLTILKTDCLKTKKNVEIDPGVNTFNFIGGTEKPFYKLAWLAKRCVPEIENAYGNLAGYFFYEIGDDGTGSGGYKFKSIDNLFQQQPKRKIIFNNTTELPVGYDAKILQYSFDSTVDIQSKLMSGSMFKTQLKTLDLYENKYKVNSFDYSKQFNENTIAGLEKFKLASDLDIQNKETNIKTKIPDIGVYPSGKTLTDQLKKSKEVNFNLDEILRQSSVRYNNLFNIKLTITIYGDFGLHAGDLIYCDFPEISNKKNQIVSQKKGGIYMIVDIGHYVTPKGPTYTKMNLVRDSIGRKPF